MNDTALLLLHKENRTHASELETVLVVCDLQNYSRMFEKKSWTWILLSNQKRSQGGGGVKSLQGSSKQGIMQFERGNKKSRRLKPTTLLNAIQTRIEIVRYQKHDVPPISCSMIQFSSLCSPSFLIFLCISLFSFLLGRVERRMAWHDSYLKPVKGISLDAMVNLGPLG